MSESFPSSLHDHALRALCKAQLNGKCPKFAILGMRRGGAEGSGEEEEEEPEGCSRCETRVGHGGDKFIDDNEIYNMYQYVVFISMYQYVVRM
jgi:hypothetical protein